MGRRSECMLTNIAKACALDRLLLHSDVFARRMKYSGHLLRHESHSVQQ